jgi:hypothetical protein
MSLNLRTRCRLAVLAVPLLAGCIIDLIDGGLPVTAPLDQVDATITISQQSQAAEATVVIRMTDSRGRLIRLEDNQAVAVNGQNVSGPDARGEYSQTITAADDYTITVSEPTRGVEETTITTPDDFTITSPTAGASVSLSGFSLAWSNADPALQVEITLTQTIFATENTQTFGPFTDTGSLTLDNDDLRAFQQGANLIITVSRIRQRIGVNGFNSATLSSELWQTVATTPAP